MIIYRIIFAHEITSRVAPAKSKAEHAVNLETARQSLVNELTQQFGQEAVLQADRVLRPLNNRKDILDILRITI